ncbi:hypothetical protein T484DRAFT_1830060 [Baffinella frigidus]|nr:hypothetical protein T484DRAFT_1830060 [Cryptophyta sp. CCMP2293]
MFLVERRAIGESAYGQRLTTRRLSRGLGIVRVAGFFPGRGFSRASGRRVGGLFIRPGLLQGLLLLSGRFRRVGVVRGFFLGRGLSRESGLRVGLFIKPGRLPGAGCLRGVGFSRASGRRVHTTSPQRSKCLRSPLPIPRSASLWEQTATLLASASSSFASSAGVTPIAPASTPLVGSFAEPPTPLSAGPTPLSGPTPLASSGLTPQASWGAASTPRAPVPTPVATPGSYTRLGASLIQTNLRGSDADKADAPPLTKLTRDRSKPADRSEPSDRSESGDRSDSDGGSDSDDNRLVMTEVPSLPRKANHASVGHSAGRSPARRPSPWQQLLLISGRA